jgi:hypothetical protein
MKTSELSGAGLDWAVAIAEGWQHVTAQDNEGEYPWLAKHGKYQDPKYYRPTSNWMQGGAIIEREKISTWFCDSVIDAETNEVVRGEAWYAETFEGEHGLAGQTALIAAMRCYVASKLGNEVEIPEGV